MKKLVLLAMLLVGNLMLTFAQNDTILFISNYPTDMTLCINQCNRVIIYAEEGCNDFSWGVNGVHH